ncbi:MAG: vitamin K epoxide reductase family protein [Parcubacteria group bacterium]|nr:vitamin K epoxide reductase family protein [Parcubacteria group bacterium]
MASYYSLVLLGFSGFLLAFYIRHKKSGREKMVCYVGKDCDTVIHSEFSEFLGLPVEILGMFYYAAIAAAYGVFSFYPEFRLEPVTFWVLALTATAFLFSLYLTFIQAVVLKEWCEWCLTSALICTGIFILAVRGISGGLLEFLEINHQSIAIVHVLAAAIGVGSATVADVLFFKFLKDLRIS